MFHSVMDRVNELPGFSLQHEDLQSVKLRAFELFEALPIQARVILSAIATLSCLQVMIHRVRRVRMYKDHLKRF